MSTITLSQLSQSEIDRLHEMREFLRDVGDARHLLRPEQLTVRLNVLDRLDAIVGDLDFRNSETFSGSKHLLHARSLMAQFAAANEMMYEAARAEIALKGSSLELRRRLIQRGDCGETGRADPGLNFDSLDDIVSGVFQFHAPGGAGLLPSKEMTAYQPTPTRHILDLIAGCRFSNDDVLVDLGSGLGHVPLLVHILAGIRTLGVEVQSDHVASARETAQRLNLSRVGFVAEDARTADISGGTVFYMFTPFTGSILKEVLDRLRRQSETRKIKICALGPCVHILKSEPWLAAHQPSDARRVTIFRSQ